MTTSSSSRPSGLLLLIAFSLQGFTTVSSCTWSACGMRLLERLSVCIKAPLQETFLVSGMSSGLHLPRYNGVLCLMVANRDVTCRMTVHVLSLTSESLVKVFLSLFALIKDSLVAIRPANMAVRAKVDPELCQQWQIMRRTKKKTQTLHTCRALMPAFKTREEMPRSNVDYTTRLLDLISMQPVLREASD